MKIKLGYAFFRNKDTELNLLSWGKIVRVMRYFNTLDNDVKIGELSVALFA